MCTHFNFTAPQKRLSVCVWLRMYSTGLGTLERLALLTSWILDVLLDTHTYTPASVLFRNKLQINLFPIGSEDVMSINQVFS